MECVKWNSGMSNEVLCVGATFGYGIYGPDGLFGGSQCWLKHRMSQLGEPRSSLNPVHAIRLIGNTTVFPCGAMLTLKNPRPVPICNATQGQHLAIAHIGGYVATSVGSLGLGIIITFLVMRWFRQETLFK